MLHCQLRMLFRICGSGKVEGLQPQRQLGSNDGDRLSTLSSIRRSQGFMTTNNLIDGLLQLVRVDRMSQAHCEWNIEDGRTRHQLIEKPKTLLSERESRGGGPRRDRERGKVRRSRAAEQILFQQTASRVCEVGHFTLHYEMGIPFPGRSCFQS